MKSGRSLKELAMELERQMLTKQDLVLPSSLLQCHTNESGRLNLTVDVGSQTRIGDGQYDVTSLARRQLADKLKIPFAYFERMREGQPDLLDRNVNTWLKSEGSKWMIRTLDDEVRAVLSDRYRRLDNFDLAEHVFPLLHRLEGARASFLLSAVLTLVRSHLVLSDCSRIPWAAGRVVKSSHIC